MPGEITMELRFSRLGEVLVWVALRLLWVGGKLVEMAVSRMRVKTS